MALRRSLVTALTLAFVTAAFLTACGSTPSRQDSVAGATASQQASSAPTVAPGVTKTVNLAGRPFQLHVPAKYHAATKAPLVVLLHGYSAGPVQQEAYFQLTAESDRRGFLYAMPGGTTDQVGKKFWNATDACCDFYRTGVDDSGYLSRLLDTVESSYSVDTTRVYLVGHSNGGFMAYRMACEHSTQITAIVSLAGSMTDDTARCKPERPVSALQIHGTEDDTIAFGGGMNGAYPYPSADGSITAWRRLDGCADRTDPPAQPLDLDRTLPGAETTVTTYATGCRDATRVSLWTIKGGGHIPALSANFAPSVVDFLYRQTSPS